MLRRYRQRNPARGRINNMGPDIRDAHSRKPEQMSNLIKQLANTGVDIQVFVSPGEEDKEKERFEGYPTVEVLSFLEESDSKMFVMFENVTTQEGEVIRDVLPPTWPMD
jgi:hypothetical protein